MAFEDDVEKSIRVAREFAERIQGGRGWHRLDQEERDGINAIETLLEYVEICRARENEADEYR